jgi:hypothetical protein
MYVAGPDPDEFSKVKRDTIYAEKEWCGDDLKTQKAENGKQKAELQTPGRLYKWYTIIECK